MEDIDLKYAERTPEGVIDPEEYFALLKRLVADGEHMYRREDKYYARAITPLRIVTLSSSGEPETDIKQKAEPIVLRFDADRYGNLRDRNIAVKKIFNNLAKRSFDPAHINNPHFLGHGIWTMPLDKWQKELPHLTADPRITDLFRISAEGLERTSRVCLDNVSEEPFTLLATWGPFPMQAGGSIATYPALIDDIRRAVFETEAELERLGGDDPALRRAVIVKHLWKLDQVKNQYVARYDVYGQEEGYIARTFQTAAEYEYARNQEGRLLADMGRFFRNTYRYGLPGIGMRVDVPSARQIDRLMKTEAFSSLAA